jgi:formate hydrogenlyase transcriptional activator
MVPDVHFGSNAELHRYEALLQMADLMVHHQDLEELFHKLEERLRELTAFDSACVILHDPRKNVMSLPGLPGESDGPTELAVEDSAPGWVWKNQQPLAISVSAEPPEFPRCLEILRRRGLQSCWLLPLTTAQRRLGALGLGSSKVSVSSEMDLRLLQRVAEMVALAVENSLTRTALQQEKERLQVLLEVNAALLSSLDLQELFPAISGFIRNAVKQEFASISLYDDATQTLRVYALDYPAHSEHMSPGAILPLRESGPGMAFLERETKILNREKLAEFHHVCTDQLLEQGVQVGCCIPLITRKGPLGVLNLASRDPNAFQPQDVSLLKQVAAQVAIAVDNNRAYSEIAHLKDKLTEEKRYLQGEIRSALNFEEIIGESPALERVLEKARVAAPSDATVLVLGETGTGKELIARAIHRMSTRKDATFIKLNCAAIPTGLLESELFGHEKGAFTGAVSQKIGRLELADKGTLFLDEVGDIPLELQPKLLRVLQDQEFERLGSTRTIKVNIRLIAATNRDLPKSVAEREFRSDLYYRINVFPLRMPALRERQGDIPLLVRYFVQKFARRMNKQIESIPKETMQAFENWEWPGNVRELENFIERSVILTSGQVLNVPLAELSAYSDSSSHEGTLQNMEREHIVRVLRETGGVVAGLSGAAARLGVKRTTLQSMIQRMGISREDYEN